MVAVRLSRREIRDLDPGELGMRIAKAARRRTTFAELAPATGHTIQDLLLGEVTWEELETERSAFERLD
ncbi:hypothetical protein ADL03_09400 [Nocardia sp. NRRL S-836]|nr:hypothetical protein ADL03_09400 [Nocardia sp. NRRL S-836]